MFERKIGGCKRLRHVEFITCKAEIYYHSLVFFFLSVATAVAVALGSLTHWMAVYHATHFSKCIQIIFPYERRTYTEHGNNIVPHNGCLCLSHSHLEYLNRVSSGLTLNPIPTLISCDHRIVTMNVFALLALLALALIKYTLYKMNAKQYLVS